jgi:hypothetical protein
MDQPQKFRGTYVSDSRFNNDPRKANRDIEKGILYKRFSDAYKYEISRKNDISITPLSISYNPVENNTLVISTVPYKEINCVQLLVREYRENLDPDKYIQITWDRLYQILDMYDGDQPIPGIYDQNNELATSVDRAYNRYLTKKMIGNCSII